MLADFFDTMGTVVGIGREANLLDSRGRLPGIKQVLLVDSLAAVAGGAPVDTTMGYTPLDGLVMATRSGSVDPGLLLWVQHRGGLSVEEVGRGLLWESGLAGLSGRSGDMRAVITAADEGDERAVLALSVYLHRLRAGIASMAAAMGGVDAVVFTGGVGENSARVRADGCAGLGFLGLAVDPERNHADEPDDRDVATAESRVRVLVIRAREDQEIAREVRRLLGKRRALTWTEAEPT
jgi:acetate kinase